MFKINWGSVIVDIVKKKDLDGGDFANCWEENYNWVDLDCFVIDNFESDCIGFAEVSIENGFEDKELKNWNTDQIKKDLYDYRKHIKVVKNETKNN